MSAQINRVFSDSLAAEIDRRHLNIIAIVNASQQIVWTKTRSKVRTIASPSCVNAGSVRAMMWQMT